MNRRERVLTALKHREPDRIPIDLGGMDSTGITAIAYNKLKKHLGISNGKTQIYDPFQQVVKVELEVLEKIGADVLPLILEPRKWKPSTLPDGSACEIPEKWNPEAQKDGSTAVRDENGTITARMPKDGFYFEPVNPPLAGANTVKDIEKNMKYIESFDSPSYCDEGFEDLGKRAKHICENTDYAVMGNFAVHIFAAGQLLRGFEQFMMDLVINPEIAECIMENLARTFIERFDRYNRAAGGYTQIISVNDDLGQQESLQISPELYRRMVKPYHKMLYRHIKDSSKAFLFLHSDGSVYDIIGDLIETGVDILNPVQFNCRNMDLKKLKKEFGRDIVFWGGSCDTQKVLPSATPAEVKKHAKECVSILAPGGGFVFNQLHNIQPDVPPENIMAMYEAVREFNRCA
jgi:uroporphyrinogen decarboxylase